MLVVLLEPGNCSFVKAEMKMKNKNAVYVSMQVERRKSVPSKRLLSCFWGILVNPTAAAAGYAMQGSKVNHKSNSPVKPPLRRLATKKRRAWGISSAENSTLGSLKPLDKASPFKHAKTPQSLLLFC